MKDYKSPSEVIIRKKAGLKETQKQDWWEGVGLPVRRVKLSKIRYAPKHTHQKMNVVRGARRGYGEADPGAFPHKNIIRTGNIVKDVNVDMFKDRPYKKKK